jgi:hypothetical protein
MLSIVSWFWKPPAHYRSQFNAGHVNTLRNMVRRHYREPHRFICVTDSPTGIDKDIEVIPLWTDFSNVLSPHGPGNPSCYRRLKAFSAEAEAMFGKRFVSMDLDCVIVGDLAPLFDRPEDFIIWGDTNPKTPYNGGLFLMTAGARRKVWDDFDPHKSPVIGRKLGYFGSDQAWIGACLGPHEARWTKADGVYSYRNEIAKNRGHLPANARLISFHGHVDPDSREAQRLEWVREHYA